MTVMQRAPLILTLLLSTLSLIAFSTDVLAQPANDSKPEKSDADTPEEGGETAERREGNETDNTPAPDPAERAAEDLQALRAEYFKLRDRLFQSRARSSAVSSALYSTRLSIKLNYQSGRYYTITRTTIGLDGTNIYDDSEGSIASDKATRFEGFIAPGRHQISIRIEATGKDDDRFSSVLDNSFIVQAVKDKDLMVKARAEDGGNIAYKWSKKESGSYRLRLDVSVKSVKRDKKKSGHIKRRGELRKHGPAKTNRS